jgi:hypothetical protein
MSDRKSEPAGAASAQETAGLISLAVFRYALRHQYGVKVEPKELRNLVSRGALPAMFVEAQGYRVDTRWLPEIAELLRRGNADLAA